MGPKGSPYGSPYGSPKGSPKGSPSWGKNKFNKGSDGSWSWATGSAGKPGPMIDSEGRNADGHIVS
jgi:hypothetical protein